MSSSASNPPPPARRQLLIVSARGAGAAGAGAGRAPPPPPVGPPNERAPPPSCCLVAAGAAAAAREDDVVRDDVRAIALLAVLLVGRRGEAPLDEDGRPLAQDLRQRLAALPPHGDRVPLGPLLARVVPVEIALGRREAELQDRLPPRRLARSSGSAPRFPKSITLFKLSASVTLLDIEASLFQHYPCAVNACDRRSFRSSGRRPKATGPARFAPRTGADLKQRLRRRRGGLRPRAAREDEEHSCPGRDQSRRRSRAWRMPQPSSST